MGKVVLAIDSFKGCLSSEAVEATVERGFRAVFPQLVVESVPVADGGEGWTRAVRRPDDRPVACRVHGPLFDWLEAGYVVSPDGKTAVLELAAAAGLSLVPSDRLDPMRATTYGVGELIADALGRGCRRFRLGIGGSATNDAGTGLLQALGFRFQDGLGRELPVGGGRILGAVAAVDDRTVHPLLREAVFEVACDVRNPLFGLEGAACVFAPQKGADAVAVQELDAGLRNFAAVVERFNGRRIGALPGAGAAGGAGGGLAGLLGARLRPGIEWVLEDLAFDRTIEGASLIVTGEGRMDRQTLSGKVPWGVLAAGRARGVPVVALAGRIDDREPLLAAGFSALFEITPREQPLPEAMQPGMAVKNILRIVQSSEFVRMLSGDIPMSTPKP